jgi:hypothetical protein
MKRTSKIILGGALAVAVVGGLILAYLFVGFPKVDAPSNLHVESTPALVQRGEYLAGHVAVCLDCHSTRDWKRYSGPPRAGTLGSGGEQFTREMGFPGFIYAKNITPAGLSSWSDGEVARAITGGISKDGRALFPIMPYPNYRRLCEEDVNAIIAFVRSLAPVNRPNQEGKLDFPMNIIVRTIPGPAEPRECPQPGTADYGKYVTTVAGCAECHTEQEHGKHRPGREFAGGWTFPLPSGGHITSANITPDAETGIGRWTRQEFIAKFKAFASPDAATPVSAGGMNTIMPWTMYAGMTAEDLGAIFDYLRTQRAVHNVIERFRL